MKPAPLPANEDERIAALLRYDVLDTEFEAAYDELTELAAAICGTPISLISLIDPERQWFKSKVGLNARETPRDLAFCAHAILQEKVFVVEDASTDDRFSANPLVVSDPHIRFYAGAPLVTPDGHILGTLCVIDNVPRKFDIDQQKALHVLANQVMIQMELRLTYKRLQTYALHGQESNAAKDRFLYIIAHDLKGPFNWMIGYAKLLEENLTGPGMEESKEMAGEISQGCESTLTLLDSLLEWAVYQSGRTEFRPTWIDLNELIDQVIALLAGMAGNKSIHLIREASETAEVHADRYMVFSVLQNLLHNSIKFTPEGGTVRIGLTDDGDEAVVTVTDTGVGISSETLHSLLQHEEPTSTKGTAGEKGTGLGLLLCKQFAEKNNGRFEAQSEPGKGSCFTFALNMLPSPIPDDSTAPEPTRQFA